MTTGQDRKPSVGGWGWAIVLFGWLGGLIGYFSLKSDDEPRANHVMKWGLIWTAISGGLWIGVVLLVIAVASTSGSGNSTASGSASSGATSASIPVTTQRGPCVVSPASADPQAVLTAMTDALATENPNCATAIFANPSEATQAQGIIAFLVRGYPTPVKPLTVACVTQQGDTPEGPLLSFALVYPEANGRIRREYYAAVLTMIAGQPKLTQFGAAVVRLPGNTQYTC